MYMKRTVALATKIHRYYRETKNPDIHEISLFLESAFEAVAQEIKAKCENIARVHGHQDRGAAHTFCAVAIEKEIRHINTRE